MSPNHPREDRRSRRGRGCAVPLVWALLVACGAPQSEPGEREGMRDGSGPAEANSPQERLPPRGEAWVVFGSDTVQAEVARTPAEREQGLMYREKLAEGRGMLFVFPDAQFRSFWMRNTFIPLDIAYLDENLTIVDVQTMQPQSEDLHESARPAMFALEVPEGWFAARGIAVGATARVVFGPG